MKITIDRKFGLKLFAHVVAKVEGINIVEFDDIKFLLKKINEYVPVVMHTKLANAVFNAEKKEQRQYKLFFHNFIFAIRFQEKFDISQKALKYFFGFLDKSDFDRLSPLDEKKFDPDLKMNEYVGTHWMLCFPEKQINEKLLFFKELGIAKAIIFFRALTEVEVLFLNKKGNIIESYLGSYEILSRQNEYLKIILDAKEAHAMNIKMLFYVGREKSINFAIGSIEDRENRALVRQAIIEKIENLEHTNLIPSFYFNNKKRSSEIPRSFWFYLIDKPNHYDFAMTSRTMFDHELKDYIILFDKGTIVQHSTMAGLGSEGYEGLITNPIDTETAANLNDLTDFYVYKRIFNDNDLMI